MSTEPIVYGKSLRHDGVTYQHLAELSGTGVERRAVLLPAAKAGTLTTRTNGTEGVITFASGHGFSTSDVIDLYWSGGCRSGVSLTVAGDSATLAGGDGDDLPAQGSAVAAMLPVEQPWTVDGDEIRGLVATASVQAQVSVYEEDDGPSLIDTFVCGFNRSFIWCDESGEDNPLEGKITSVARFSHGALTPQVVRIFAVTGGS